MPQQPRCCDMCKIMPYTDEYFSNKKLRKFHKINILNPQMVSEKCPTSSIIQWLLTPKRDDQIIPAMSSGMRWSKIESASDPLSSPLLWMNDEPKPVLWSTKTRGKN